MSRLDRVVDGLLEASVVGSFSRIGFQVRSRLEHWPALDDGRPLAGRSALVTGATSGIGLAAATRLAALGASVRVVGRDEERAIDAVAQIRRAGGDDAAAGYDLLDVADLDAVRRFAETVNGTTDGLDLLVHSAGALTRERREAPDGTEQTFASHVLGPFLLTGLLLPLLRRRPTARVITVSSGGMYTQRLDVDELEMDAEHYDGTVAYARAKRAQVVLNHEWARRVPAREVVFHAMHPGWVDTPGVASGLPGFHRVMGPLLRSPEQGADTLVWLASASAPLESTGAFWHDRRARGEHHLPWTRGGDDGAALWELCCARTGLERED
jgi:NAD(P)-dependent dehydrogenase (short-subunit alcohol dehydrogenase family)